MRKLILPVLSGLLCMASVSATSLAGDQISCTDPSLFQYFDTAEEAEAGCPKFDNVFVIYDWYYKKYTCGCTAPDNGGGNG